MKNDNNFDEKKHALATNFGRNYTFCCFFVKLL